MHKAPPQRDFTPETIELAPGIRALPIVHASVEFTVLIRELFLQSPPAMVVLELPENLHKTIERVIPFADEIPVIEISRGSEKNYFIVEPLEPLVEALRSSVELNIPCHLVDIFNEPVHIWVPENFPDTFSLRYLSVSEMYRLYEKSRENHEKNPIDFLVERIDYRREIYMAGRLRNLSQFVSRTNSVSESILMICGFRHISVLKKLLALSDDQFNQARLDSFVNNASAISGGQFLSKDDEMEEPLEALLNESAKNEDNSEDTNIEISFLSRKSPEVLEQPAYFNAIWNMMRINRNLVLRFNRIALQRSLYRDTVNRYEKESHELIHPSKEKLFFRFTRNWSIVENRLLPDAYRLITAARGFVNDNFARLMYEILNFLPPVRSSVFPTKKLTLDELHKNSRLIRFRLKHKIKRKLPPPEILRRFKREKYPGEWREAWQGGGICSYPPEDLKIEDFGRYLQKQARALIHGTESKTAPFTTSLLDGIDYRETIRNLHLGKIFVREMQTSGLEAGSVIVIFSEDEAEFNWKVVWWGEHDQESDMAFYATPPGIEMAGPGIGRCHYGGFLLSYPPGRLHDIWNDDYYEEFSNPADRLLAAAIEYNEKNAVVHLSNRPPNPRLQSIAGRMGQKIIHIPINTVNSVMLGRVQRFHVLDSKERRDDADDFIW